MHPHHHSLEGNNPLRGTGYMKHDNQGIVDGRPEGRQPSPSPILLDTVVDQNASTDDKDKIEDLSAQSMIPGATSRDVYGGLSVPILSMSSNEPRHDDRPGRKERGGVEQLGAKGHDEGTRRIDDVTGKIAFREG